MPFTPKRRALFHEARDRFVKVTSGGPRPFAARLTVAPGGEVTRAAASLRLLQGLPERLARGVVLARGWAWTEEGKVQDSAG